MQKDGSNYSIEELSVREARDKYSKKVKVFGIQPYFEWNGAYAGIALYQIKVKFNRES